MKKSKEMSELTRPNEEFQELMDGVMKKAMKEGRSQPNGYYPDFATREALAQNLGQEITSYLLEKMLYKDFQIEEMFQAKEWSCVKCQKPSSRAQDTKGDFIEEKVIYKSEAGTIALPGPIFCCTKCRQNFSPLKAIIKSRL